ncbi:MAG TPA: DUF1289 domain-containing protein [Methylophilaceae bacterium]|jgi:hypothetical protein
MTDKQVEQIVSPCVGVCAMNEATGFCHGCYRTIDEIQDWWDMPASKRMQVMGELDGRQAESLDFGD